MAELAHIPHAGMALSRWLRPLAVAGAIFAVAELVEAPLIFPKKQFAFSRQPATFVLNLGRYVPSAEIQHPTTMEDRNSIIIYNTQDGKATVALHARDGSVWMNQQQLAELFATSVPNISVHVANILEDKELSADSVVKYFLTTESDGKQYEVAFYALDMILAIGFRVRSKRGTQFLIWANQNLKTYSKPPKEPLDECISRENARKALLECTNIAAEVGLAEMTMEEISAEVKAVREAKRRA